MQWIRKEKPAEDAWDEYKSIFMEYFEVNGTVQLNFFALHNLKQGPMQKVWDLFTRGQAQCEWIHKGLDHGDIVALIKQDFDAALRPDMVKEKQEATATVHGYYKKMIFIAGLHREIHTKVIEANKKSVYDTLKVAVYAETMIAGQKGQFRPKTKIWAMQQEVEELQGEEMHKDKLKAVNAIQFQKGK